MTDMNHPITEDAVTKALSASRNTLDIQSGMPDAAVERARMRSALESFVSALVPSNNLMQRAASAPLHQVVGRDPLKQIVFYRRAIDHLKQIRASRHLWMDRALSGAEANATDHGPGQPIT